MDKYRINPSKLHGALSVPTSKSHSLRAILFGVLAKGTSKIAHYLPSPDADAMIAAVRMLGAEVKIAGHHLEIRGVAGKPHIADDIPRIRGLKKLMFFRPIQAIRYRHIDSLFGDVVNWRLIETHLPDMLRIVLSIKVGKISPSAILRRLGTKSRKNKLYFAFRELGRVVRTVFLLKYVGNVEIRKMVQSATNKSEEFNNFAQWLFFGSDGELISDFLTRSA